MIRSYITAALLSITLHAAAQDSLSVDTIATDNTTVDTTASRPAARPKVALVLSGGGAKGMAHVGAIKVLEEAGIPIDIVTGTSMGSIVGGLYSVGWNADDMLKRISTIDWSQVLSDRPAYYTEDLSGRMRQDTYMLSKTISLTKQKNVSEVGGVLQGKNLDLLFNTLYTGYTDSIDFATLPRPFACVATDIVTNTEYDWHSGRLPEAIRSSMAIPMAFTPIRKGDMLLVDGGLRNNYPVDLARQLGADYVIGCTVQSENRTADQLESSTAILTQIIDINCKNKYEEHIADTDLLVRVNTEGYGAASFSDNAIDTLMMRGEKAARAQWPAIMALKEKLGLAPDYKPELTHPNPEAMVEPDYSAMKTRTVDQPTLTASIGARFDTEEIVAAQLSALYRPAHKPFELEAVLRLGERIRAGLQGAWLVGDKGSKLGLGYTFHYNDLNIYHEGAKLGESEFVHHNVNLALAGMGIRNLQLDLGIRFDYYHYADSFYTAASKRHLYQTPLDEHYISYFAKLHYSSERDAYFPRRGARFMAYYAYHTDNFAKLGTHNGASELAGHWRISLPLSKHLTFQPLAYGRFIYGAGLSSVRANMVGGPWFGHYLEQQMPFAGVGHLQIVDPHMLALQFQLQEQFTTNNYISLRFAGAIHGQKASDITKHHPYLGGELAYYYRTMFGPVGASLGYSNITKKVNFLINLGFEF